MVYIRAITNVIHPHTDKNQPTQPAEASVRFFLSYNIKNPRIVTNTVAMACKMSGFISVSVSFNC